MVLSNPMAEILFEEDFSMLLHKGEPKMFGKQKNETINSAVQERLDYLFEKSDTPATIKEAGEDLTHYSLVKLKSLVLSIEWEITEKVLFDFFNQIDNLSVLYENDKIILKFLKMLEVLGKYLNAYQSNAHPHAFNLLYSVFCALEIIVTTQDMAGLDKQKLFTEELGKYKELQKLISESKRINVKGQQKKPSTFQVPKMMNNNLVVNSARNLDLGVVLISNKQLNDAINEIKNFVHSEFISLKEMLLLDHNI